MVSARVGRMTGLVLLGSCAAWCGCGAPVITADDVVMAPGQPARFEMSLDRQFGKASVVGADVEFLVDGKRVGSAQTDGNGVATLRAEVPGHASAYTVRARVGSEVVESRGRIFPWNGSRTAVAVDVDETISATDYGALFLTDVDTTSPHLEHSPDAVRAIAAHYDIVYLSARPRWLHEKTKLWLDAHGFPPGPILHAAKFEACFQQEYYKREMLKEFQREFPNLLIGVGDKDVDERAYGDNRMLGVILEQSANGYGNGCIVKPDWQGVQEFFVNHRESLTDAQRLRQMIHSNNGELRSYFENAPQYSSSGTMAAGRPPAVAAPDQAQRPQDRRASAGSGRPTGRGDWIYGYK